MQGVPYRRRLRLTQWPAQGRVEFFNFAFNSIQLADFLEERIRELYAVEREGKELDTPARHESRQTKAKLILEALHVWLLATRTTVAEGSGLARAIDCSLKRWPALVRYANNGDLPTDNNPIENAIRLMARNQSLCTS